MNNIERFSKYLQVPFIKMTDNIEKGVYKENELQILERGVKIRFLAALATTTAVSLYSPGYVGALAVSFLMVFFGGAVFIYPSYGGAREKHFNSFLPLSLAILILFLLATLTESGGGYFNLVNSLVAFSLFGYWLEIKERIKVHTHLNTVADEKSFSEFAAVFSLFFGLAVFLFWRFAIGLFPVLALSFGIAAMLVISHRAMRFALTLPLLRGAAICADKTIAITNRLIFSKTSAVDDIVFIKTRILTTGQFQVSDMVALAGFDKMGILREQASLESISSHPVSQAIVEEAKKQRLGLAHPQDAQVVHGEGVQGIIDGKKVLVGNFSFMAMRGINVVSAKKYVDQFSVEGKSISFIAVDGQLAGLTAVYDELRPSSAVVVNKIKNLGFEVHLITGDSAENASSVSKRLSIDNFLGSASADKKVDYIKRLQQVGKKVAVIGEEATDTAVLNQADISVKITEEDISPTAEKEVIIRRFDPMSIFSFFKISKMVSYKISQNLYLTVIPTVLSSILAAGVFYVPFGLYIPVDFASFLAFLGSVAIIINSSRIKKESI